jgi:exopolyphosphatase/guanosine-5'-triphosphate,3'-diphosphate pyrophosphatase
VIVAGREGEGPLAPLHLDRRVTRLAQGFQGHGLLAAESMTASLDAVADFMGSIRELGAQCVACGATGVVRRASNGRQLLEAIHKRWGIPCRLLSEDEEALLAAKGILSGGFDEGNPIIGFDLGGGSTEIMLLDPAAPKPLWLTSVSAGAATVTHRFLDGDPPSATSLARASREVRGLLEPALREVERALEDCHAPTESVEVVGTAGTVTTLAAIRLEMVAYRPYRVNGLVLEAAWIRACIERLARLQSAERCRVPGLEQGREDIIIGGAILVEELLRGLRHDRVAVTDAGLLEGLLLAGIEDRLGLPRSLSSPLTWDWRDH